MMSLILSWTCQRDRVLFLIKFELNKNNFILENNNNVVSSRKFNKKSKISVIYIYIYII